MADDIRARIYRQITQSSTVFAVLERMRTLGFWPRGKGLPPDPPEEAAERLAIEAELASLREHHGRIKDPEAALAEERQRRWADSRTRRAEAKALLAKKRGERRFAYDTHRSSSVVHAGIGVSGALQDIDGDPMSLRARGLPEIRTAAELAQAIGIPLATLRWLTFHRKVATLVHYHRYEIAKKTGGVRCISAPKPQLGSAQRWVLVSILDRLDAEPEAHGFVKGRSIVSNAMPHAGREIVINLDLRDFFPTITFRRVQGLFRMLGYSGQVATLLALLTTEPPRLLARLDNRPLAIEMGQRVLPQGACTSPAITNAICRRLDRRLAGLAQRHHFYYTRYADDLTFSGSNPRASGRLLRSVRSILQEEGLVEHPRKTKLMRRGRRQEVTGLTVNDRPKVARAELRRLRAILHNAAVHGLESQNREERPDFASYLRGKVAFACMADPTRAETWKVALQAALLSTGS
ncbi:MAG: reverse transcriptase family protein [Isosphaeraceae bacterium]